MRLMAVSAAKGPPEDLVSKRICGECSVCCEFVAIDTAELRKAQDVLCHHCIEPIVMAPWST